VSGISFTKIITPQPSSNHRFSSPFDKIMRIDDEGEYWFARELAPELDYDSKGRSWQTFTNVIEVAKESCKLNGHNPSDHFTAIGEMILAGKGASRDIGNVRLTRLGCYFVANSGDGRKAKVAAARLYFIVNTRENEVRNMRHRHEIPPHVRADVVEKMAELRQQVEDKTTDLKLGKKGAPEGNENAVKEPEPEQEPQPTEIKGDNITFDSVDDDQRGTDRSYTIRRLKRDKPELAERVIRGELSANAAAIEAGFRIPMINVPADPHRGRVPPNKARRIYSGRPVVDLAIHGNSPRYRPFGRLLVDLPDRL
jgi:hypothetical protein